ncbi:MAG: alpha/beta hydrolase [Rhodobacteraceae bacterium]|nr:alpha/beta hydrolase [Paracoccaceae bacterium]
MSKLAILWGFLRLNLPEPIVAALYGERREIVEGRRINAKAKAASDLVALLRAGQAMPSVEESRQQLAAMAAKLEKPCPASVAKQDITLPGAEGMRPARVYLPEGVGDEAATLLFLHGGGWIQGGIETHDGLCGRLAEMAGVRVISYDYRLAPESPFPAAVDDVLACYKGLVGGNAEVRADPARLVVGGDSAGGNLTACLMHDLCEAGVPLPAGQVLLYPGVDARLSTESMQDLRDQPLLPAERIDWYLGMYLPEAQDRQDPRVSPIFSRSLGKQPPAFIVAAGHDPLWDDARNYAEMIRAAGGEVEIVEYPGQIHAFMSLTKVIPQGDEALRETARWLRARLG